MKTNTTGLEFKIHEMSARIAELREIQGYTIAEMALKTDTTEAEYESCERGETNLTFAFIYRCALALGVDVTDIIEGKSPNLAGFTVTKSGHGQVIEKAHGMTYHSLAASFKNRVSEPLYVVAEYDPEAERHDIELTTHEGQECDIVIKGALMVQVGEHKEVLHEGDSIYYDSSVPHGMIAVEKTDCLFYAIVLDPNGEQTDDRHKLIREKAEPELPSADERIYKRFISVKKDMNGTPEKITFKDPDNFNFAFDIIDTLGREKPDKLAMLYVADDGVTEKRFTFKEISRASSQCANYFKSLGIRKGDRVMLVLKRHYQFWFAMLGLNKLGAIAIPATSQLVAHDFEYRFNKAGVTAILCTADGDTANQVDLASQNCPTLKTKILVNQKTPRDGWRDFDSEYDLFSGKFERKEDSPKGEDLLLMFFTSGTTGYPKIAAHNHKYTLGHFHTAKYWHCVDSSDTGLHLTVSDTGWAKAMWGKMYGQWICEAAIFVFDFDRFDAAKMLPMFKKYGITTFCAPPTIYRMLIKEDLSKYDFSSLKHATTAGEALNPEVYKQFKSITGLEIKEGFGQSETTCMIGNLRGAPHKVGSMGRPVPIYDVHLIDQEGNETSDGETGEIVINVENGAPCGLFTGYYLDEEKTREAWHDGYYHTGDLAWRDEDGFYWYVGRIDDVIKSSGYRIGPFEIENVIMELPYVLECGVSAVPDDVRGQIVKASIVLTKGTEGTEELKKEIQNYVKKNTAPYKYPRIVEFRDELPKTTSGKIMRNRL